jgi:hypothetical protein
MIHRNRRILSALLMSTLLTPATTLAGLCEVTSGSATVALLELYTSEGCSSCPPADRWLAELPRRGVDAARVVPLAFHVDYWNYLGWTDRFSQAAFTERQREFARRNNSRSVYTPEFVLHGREYRRWSFGSFDADVARINRQPPRADITLRLERQAQALKVDATATLKQGSAANLFLAVYENNLRSDVRAGENSGRQLEHAFVVHRLIGPLSVDAKGQRRLSETFKLDPAWKAADLGVAAFVQETRGTDILQALALAVCS